MLSGSTSFIFSLMYALEVISSSIQVLFLNSVILLKLYTFQGDGRTNFSVSWVYFLGATKIAYHSEKCVVCFYFLLRQPVCLLGILWALVSLVFMLSLFYLLSTSRMGPEGHTVHQYSFDALSRLAPFS